MSVGVCFKREKKLWMQDQWSNVLSNFEITEVWEYGAGDEGTDWNIYQKPVQIENADALPDMPIVVVQPQSGKFVQGAIPLDKFVHPESAIYMFGGSHDVMTEEDIGQRVPYRVFIPIHQECYAFSAAYMTLWSRRQANG